MDFSTRPLCFQTGGAWEAPAGCVCKDGETGLRGAQAPGSGDLDVGAWALCMCFPGGSHGMEHHLQTRLFQSGLRWCLPLPLPSYVQLLPDGAQIETSDVFPPLTPTCKPSADPVAAAFRDCPELPLLTPVLTTSEGVLVNTHQAMLLFCSQTLHGSHLTRVLPVAHKALRDLSPSPPCLLSSLTLFRPPGVLPAPQHARHSPASASLHLSPPLPGTLFPQMCAWLVPSLPLAFAQMPIFKESLP